MLPVTPPEVLTLATVGLLEVHVSGAEIKLPVVSATVGVIEALVPFAAVIVVPPAPFTDRVIDCTGQVVKLKGTLVVFAMEAKTWVTPGAFGRATTCPLRTPLTA
jgi:hypothetical protein